MADDPKRTQGEQLSEPFPLEMLKRHPTKGLTYVPIPEVVARLNRVLGFGNWSTKILSSLTHGEIKCTTGNYPKWIVVTVNLTGTVDGVPFSYDGFGGQEVKFLKAGENKPSYGPVDIGDEYKGAMSDATKKAAQSLGVGLDLAREDDAMHYEQALREADEPKAPAELMDRMRDHAASLEGDFRKEFIGWWNRLTGDGQRGKRMDGGQVTVREADQALEYLEEKGHPVPPPPPKGRGRRQQNDTEKTEAGEKQPADA